MWLIATDEAGYGPKLGPLVVTATTWWVDDEAVGSLAEAFGPFANPVKCDGVTVRIDDSKAIYKPASQRKVEASDTNDGQIPMGLRSLHTAVSAATCMAGMADRTFASWLSRTADLDKRATAKVPWLCSLDGGDLADAGSCRDVLDVWLTSPARLHGFQSRVIGARRFNEFCESGRNKADLLSTTTLGLVRRAMEGLVSTVGEPPAVEVHCDRHGGRRYYADVLQQVWSDAGGGTCEDVEVRIIDETKQESRYRLSGASIDADVRFTVKGDRFTPVAMSSIIAKYTRERLMGSFNAYFKKRHRGPSPLKPTAGYPVDADRFLTDVESIIQEHCILKSDLVRCR